MSEQTEHRQDRDGDRGDSNSGETQAGKGDRPSQENSRESTEKANREAGTQGDVAHEGDLPTETIPEAD